MLKKIEILLDNGGGILLQTAQYCHSYDWPQYAADDIRCFLASGDTSDWEGNEPEYRRKGTATDDVLTRDELAAIVLAGKAIARVSNGASGRQLVTALLGFSAREAIARD